MVFDKVIDEPAICPVLPPCIGCNNRTETCHIKGNCHDYDKFKFKADVYKRLRNSDKAKESRYYEHKAMLYRRTK